MKNEPKQMTKTYNKILNETKQIERKVNLLQERVE